MTGDLMALQLAKIVAEGVEWLWLEIQRIVEVHAGKRTNKERKEGRVAMDGRNYEQRGPTVEGVGVVGERVGREGKRRRREKGGDG
eukprot:scaffold180048_cov33-Tisochrysis_lutea.AAC.1